MIQTTILTTDVNGIPVAIPLTDELVSSILQHLRGSGKADKNFDINLAEGKKGESDLLKLLNDKTLEVKTDFMVSKTGNVAIEYRCYDKPSGITATKADYWAIALEGDKYKNEVIVLIKTERLRTLIQNTPQRNGGDFAKSEMHLLPVVDLVKPLKPVSQRPVKVIKKNETPTG